jgi:XTP/dITP diphosphohydrolase
VSHPARELVMGTHNRDKGREMASHLSHLPLILHGLWEWADHSAIEETEDTLAANAILKAEDAMRHTGKWALADDTGLLVPLLNGAPGVFSARYAGPGATYADNRRKLLMDMATVPQSKRQAEFRTTMALARPGYVTLTVDGICLGHILTEERGELGFGYDAVFYHEASGRTFAEMSLVEKNQVSHRGCALKAVSQLLGQLLARPDEQGGPQTKVG